MPEVNYSSCWGGSERQGRIIKILERCFKRKDGTRLHLHNASIYCGKFCPRELSHSSGDTSMFTGMSVSALFKFRDLPDVRWMREPLHYRGTSSHTKRRKPNPSTQEPDEKREISVTTATAKSSFSLRQPWERRHRAAENYSTAAPKDSVSFPELRIMGISIWQPAICQWSL